jgi:tetratricopeptide (TPR) repeat protein
VVHKKNGFYEQGKHVKLGNFLRISLKAVLIFMALGGILSAGCAQKQKNPRGSSYYLSLENQTIENEISRLEKATEGQSSRELKAKSLFYLALLYSHYNNSFPDYEQALKNLEEFVHLNPDAGNRNSVQYLRALLEEIKENNDQREDLKEDLTALKEKNDQLEHRILALTEGDDYIRDSIAELMRENEKLKKMNQDLSLQNQSMKEIIEKLKRLDVQLEEKRKTIE